MTASSDCAFYLCECCVRVPSSVWTIRRIELLTDYLSACGEMRGLMSHMAFDPGMGNPANCLEPVGFILKIHEIRIQLDKEAKFRLTNRHETRRNRRAIPEIECLPPPINQVIMNTVVNATHAIGPERRRITIRTRDDDGSVEVADTGSGIPKEILSRIVDPFFTTKPVSKGTGGRIVTVVRHRAEASGPYRRRERARKRPNFPHHLADSVFGTRKSRGGPQA